VVVVGAAVVVVSSAVVVVVASVVVVVVSSTVVVVSSTVVEVVGTLSHPDGHLERLLRLPCGLTYSALTIVSPSARAIRQRCMYQGYRDVRSDLGTGKSLTMSGSEAGHPLVSELGYPGSPGSEGIGRDGHRLAVR